MKTVRKVLALLLLTVVLCAASSAVAAESSYSDVPTDYWAYDVITKWSGDAGVLEGDGNGAFLPEQPLQLGELAAILSRSLGYTERTEVDVTPAWADEYVEKAVAAGVIEAASSIDASVTLTRQEAIRYIAIAYGIDALDGDTSFVDDADIDETCKAYVNTFQRLGYVIGKGNDDFDPKASYTRAEAMMVLDRISQPGIIGVTSIGFVDLDGSKVSAIAVEYNVDLTGAAVSADSYTLTMNNVTDVTAIYVNDAPEVSQTGGSGTGCYVIIEVDTDYLMSSEQAFAAAMAVGVTQTKDISYSGGVISARDINVGNYNVVAGRNNTTTNNAIYGTYTIEGIEGFKYYTNVTGYGEPDGPAFHAEDCFNEQDGLYYDVDLSYALYVPEDYDPNGSYALVTLENPAASEGTHPFASVLETRGPSVLASEWAQNLVKETHGLDGLIVVVPTVTQRVNDNACTPAQYEALVGLWDYLLETYSIDDNYIYGIGQSVGGMVLMETNRNRDNFFAGILMYENQWAQNYYKDTLFVRNMASNADTAATAAMHYPRTDGTITWDYYFDEDGNKVYEDHDPYNYYYLISDDNVMVMNRSANNLSNATWQEVSYLYSDLVGYEIPHLTVDGTADLAAQEAEILAYLDSDNSYDGQEMGLRWVSFENGSNGYSARKVDAGYEWLLTQTRQSEMERSKLDLNKPFELADEQIQDESRLVASYTDADGNPLYYLTGKEGAGTQFYNTAWFNLTTVADAAPGWLPEGMSWETGVEGAEIQSVTPILENGTLTAVAIEYSVDMENLVIHLKGDEIIGLDGTVREDISIVLDPFDFYDADGNEIDCEITNVYVNSTASVMSGAERESGSGNYVIVELDSSSTASSVGVIQRTTLRTDTAIASATSKLYTSD